jgi:hypothetical protein
MDSNRMYEQLLNLDSKWSISDVKIERNAIVPRQLTNSKTLFSDSDVSVFPNPVVDKLNIRFDPSDGQSPVLTVFDIHGRKFSGLSVLISQEGLAQIDTEKLPRGFYTLRLSKVKTENTFRFKKE